MGGQIGRQIYSVPRLKMGKNDDLDLGESSFCFGLL